MLGSSVVDQGLPCSALVWLIRVSAPVWSIQGKLVFAVSPVSMQYQGVRTKTFWLGFRIMCPSVATCLAADLFLVDVQPESNHLTKVIELSFHG